jgi:Prokaryotic homologs of the JAB domain
MSGGQLTAITQVDVPRAVIDDTLKTMRAFGAKGWEVLVLWLGQVDPHAGTANVRVAFVPRQKPIASEDGVGYFVASDTLFQLNKALSETGLRLIAQVHSHPTEAYHSDADDRYAIVTADGGFSLVVPDFGDAPPSPAAWAVYRLRGNRWLELNRRQTESVFVIVPTT